MATAKAADHPSNDNETCTREILTALLQGNKDAKLPHPLRVTGPDGAHQLVSPNDIWSVNEFGGDGFFRETRFVGSGFVGVAHFLLDLAPGYSVPVEVRMVEKGARGIFSSNVQIKGPALLVLIEGPLARAEADMFEGIHGMCGDEDNATSYRESMAALRKDAYARVRSHTSGSNTIFDDNLPKSDQYILYRSGISPFMQIRTPRSREEREMLPTPRESAEDVSFDLFVNECLNSECPVGFHTLFVPKTIVPSPAAEGIDVPQGDVKTLALIGLLALTHSSDQETRGRPQITDGFPALVPHCDMVSTAVELTRKAATNIENAANTSQSYDWPLPVFWTTHVQLPIKEWLKATPFPTRFHSLYQGSVQSSDNEILCKIHLAIGYGDFTPDDEGFEQNLQRIVTDRSKYERFMIGHCSFDPGEIVHGYETAKLKEVGVYVEGGVYKKPVSLDWFARKHAENKIPRFLLLTGGEEVILLRIDTDDVTCKDKRAMQSTECATKDDLVRMQQELISQMKEYIDKKFESILAKPAPEEDIFDDSAPTHKKRLRRLCDDDDQSKGDTTKKPWPQWRIKLNAEMEEFDRKHPELAKKYGRA